MQVIAEPHTHSIASGHAYSTIRENCRAAAQLGVAFVCNTEHTNLMPGAPNNIFFATPGLSPKRWRGCMC